MSDSQISNFTESIAPSVNPSTGANLANDRATKLKKEKQVDEITFDNIGDKVKGIGYSAMDSNFIASMAHYGLYYSGAGEEEDSKFKERFTLDEADKLRHLHGLSTDARDRIFNAKNENHLRRIVEGYSIEKERRKFSNEVNSQAETIFGVVAGSIIDINIPIANLAYKGAKITGSAAKGFVAGTTADLAADSAYAAIKDDYGSFDVAIGTPIGMLFNYGAVKKAGRETEAIMDAHKRKVSDKEVEDAHRVSVENAIKKKEMEDSIANRIQASADRIRKEAEINIAKAKKLLAEEIQLGKISKKAEANLKDFFKKQKIIGDKARAIRKELDALEAKSLTKKITREEEEFLKNNKAAGTRSNNSIKHQEELFLRAESKLKEQFEFLTKEIRANYRYISKEASLGKGSSKAAKKIKSDIDNMINDVLKIDNTLGQKLKGEVRKATGDNKASRLKAKVNKDGTVNLLNNNGKKIGKIPYVVAASFGTVATANASEDFNIYDGISALAVLTFAGIGAKALSTKHGSIGKAVVSYGNKMRDVVNAESSAIKHKGLKKELDSIIERGTADMWGFYNTLNKAGVGELGRKLVYDFRNGLEESAEIIKQRLMHGFTGSYAKGEQELFYEYLSETANKSWNPIKRATELSRFRAAVSDAVENGGKSDIESVNKAAKHFSSTIEEVRKLANDAEVLGFNKKNIDNYLPRLWRHDSVKSILAQTDDAGRKLIHEAITKSVIAKQKIQNAEIAKATAEHLIGFFEDTASKKGKYGDKEIGDLISHLKTQFGDEIDEGIIAGFFSKSTEATGRLQYRIDLDLGFLDNMTINQNGIKTTFNKGDFVERNSYNIMQQYLNEMSGSIALAKKNFKSEADLDRVILSAPIEVRETLTKIKDSLMGRPLLDDPHNLGNQIVASIRNVAIAMSMPLIVLSTSPEFLTVTARALVSRSGFKQYSRELKNIFKQYDKDDFFINELSKITGLGSSQISHDLSLRGLENMDNAIEGLSTVEKTTAKMRDIAIKTFGLPKATDFYERVEMAMNYEKLGRIVNGRDTISSKKMKQYGITAESIEMLKAHMKISNKGKLKQFDISSMAKKDQEELGKIIKNMVNSRIQKTTLGATPEFFLDNSFGKLLGTMMGFGLNSYTNLGMRKAYNRDMDSFMSSGIWFAGAYAGVLAREKVTGNENTQTERIVKSAMNMPMLAPLSIPSALNGAGVNTMANMGDTLDFYSKQYE